MGTTWNPQVGASVPTCPRCYVPLRASVERRRKDGRPIWLYKFRVWMSLGLVKPGSRRKRFNVLRCPNCKYSALQGRI